MTVLEGRLGRSFSGICIISREVLYQRPIRRQPLPSLVEPTNLRYISELGVPGDRHVYWEDFVAHCLKVVYTGASRGAFEVTELS